MHTKIFTDSTCDLNAELRAQHNITALPLHVYLGDESYLDGVNVTPEMLFSYADETKQLPKTAAVSLLELTEAFQDALDHGYSDVLYTGLSSKLSSTFNNACLARDTLIEMGYDRSRFHIIDSLQLSSGEAHLLLRAADVLENGGTAQEAEQAMLEIVPRIRTHFVVDTLHYLHMGGRCSSVAYLAGSMLKLHPQINMIDGAMSVGEKFRGKLDRCIQNYKKATILDHLEEFDPERIFVTSSMTLAETDALADEIRALGYFKEVLPETAGATISSHCGPNTIGYLAVLKA